MEKCYLLIKDLNDNEIVVMLAFNNVANREKAEEIFTNASSEWNENALESFIENFDLLDEEIKPMYEHLLGINCEFEYQMYCLENSNIEFERIDNNYIDIYWI